MATVTVKVNGVGLLDYAKAGREAVKEVQKTVRAVLNVGRKEARQRISSEFRVRTGFLRRQARRMQTKAMVTQAEVKGRVAPIPRLVNIFENGAHLANGRGFLRPRPVVTPAAAAMERGAVAQFEKILRRVGK
jgi:hypothetical protein